MAIELQAAATALHEHYGTRLEAGRDEGERLMVDALQDELGISKKDAEDAVKALIAAHTVRWVERGVGTVPMAVTPFAETLGAEVPGGEPEIPVEEGYWQL